MPDHDADTVVTPAVGAPRAGLPAAPERPDSHLPGLEPERRITDWGRSERVEALVDRTVYGFLFHYWFRVEVEAVENVPAAGGALLVANRSGALPHDGAMIAKAIGERHQRPRPVHFVADRRRRALPVLGTLATKLGAVPDHPADVVRLLRDEGELALAFPERAPGAAKPVHERYRLREFSDRRSIEAALEAGVPIVPVAVMGAEEAAPVFARLALPRLRPLTFGPAPLPAKFRIRFLEPVEAGASAEELRALIQENLLEMVAQRRSVWLG